VVRTITWAEGSHSTSVYSYVSSRSISIVSLYLLPHVPPPQPTGQQHEFESFPLTRQGRSPRYRRGPCSGRGAGTGPLCDGVIQAMGRAGLATILAGISPTGCYWLIWLGSDIFLSSQVRRA
jgi:hypothetical protein